MELGDIQRALRTQDVDAFAQSLSHVDIGQTCDDGIRMALLSWTPQEREVLRAWVEAWFQRRAGEDLHARSRAHGHVMNRLDTHLQALAVIDRIHPPAA